MAYHHEPEAIPKGRNAVVEHTVAKPRPEEDVAHNLKPALPPCRTLPRSLAAQEIVPAEQVEVEATEGQDRVVKIVLKANEKARGGIKDHDAIVVR